MSPTSGPLISDYTNYNIIYFVIQHTLLSMLGVRRNFISTCQINIILIIWGLLSAYCLLLHSVGAGQMTDNRHGNEKQLLMESNQYVT